MGLRLIGNPVATSLVNADVAAVKVRLAVRTAPSSMETATTVESMVTESPIVVNDKLTRKAAQLQCTNKFPEQQCQEEVLPQPQQSIVTVCVLSDTNTKTMFDRGYVVAVREVQQCTRRVSYAAKHSRGVKAHAGCVCGVQHPEYILADSGSDAHVCNERFAPPIPIAASQKTIVKLFDVRQAEMPIVGVKERYNSF